MYLQQQHDDFNLKTDEPFHSPMYLPHHALFCITTCINVIQALRGVRFAARFGFSLDDDLKQAACTNRVRVALQTKVGKLSMVMIYRTATLGSY